MKKPYFFISIEKIFACILLFILFPFLLFISFLIYIFMGKPIFFNQIRLGYTKHPFVIHKFRTMSDGQISFLGKLLRATGIDELPQLLNILKGEMSFVGPRPLTDGDIQRLGWNTSYYEKRWDAKPGLTGLAQLSLKCHVKLSWFYDRYYVTHQSFLLDVKILFFSFFVTLLGKNRVKKIIHKKIKK